MTEFKSLRVAHEYTQTNSEGRLTLSFFANEWDLSSPPARQPHHRHLTDLVR